MKGLLWSLLSASAALYSSSSNDGGVDVRKYVSITSIPETFNWMASGCLSPPIFQGACGSCAIVSLTAVAEFALCMKHSNKEFTALSHQQTIDCISKPDEPSGCFGTNPDDVIKFLVRNISKGHMCSREVLPTNHLGIIKEVLTKKSVVSCDNACPDPVEATQMRAYKLVLKNVDSVKKALLKFGPLAFTMNTHNRHFTYHGDFSPALSSEGHTGFIRQNMCHSIPEDTHAAVLIGWGIENGEEYWLLWNTFGGAWGDKGIGKIPIQEGSDSCGILGSKELVTFLPIDVGLNTNGESILVWKGWDNMNRNWNHSPADGSITSTIGNVDGSKSVTEIGPSIPSKVEVKGDQAVYGTVFELHSTSKKISSKEFTTEYKITDSGREWVGEDAQTESSLNIDSSYLLREADDTHADDNFANQAQNSDTKSYYQEENDLNQAASFLQLNSESKSSTKSKSRSSRQKLAAYEKSFMELLSRSALLSNESKDKENKIDTDLIVHSSPVKSEHSKHKFQSIVKKNLPFLKARQTSEPSDVNTLPNDKLSTEDDHEDNTTSLTEKEDKSEGERTANDKQTTSIPLDDVQQPDDENVKVQQPDDENVKVQQPDDENVKVQQPGAEKDNMPQPDAEKDNMQQPDAENVKVQQPDAEKDNVQQPDAEDGPAPVNVNDVLNTLSIAVSENAAKNAIRKAAGLKDLNELMNEQPSFDDLMKEKARADDAKRNEFPSESAYLVHNIMDQMGASDSVDLNVFNGVANKPIDVYNNAEISTLSKFALVVVPVSKKELHLVDQNSNPPEIIKIFSSGSATRTFSVPGSEEPTTQYLEVKKNPDGELILRDAVTNIFYILDKTGKTAHKNILAMYSPLERMKNAENESIPEKFDKERPNATADREKILEEEEKKEKVNLVTKGFLSSLMSNVVSDASVKEPFPDITRPVAPVDNDPVPDNVKTGDCIVIHDEENNFITTLTLSNKATLAIKGYDEKELTIFPLEVLSNPDGHILLVDKEHDFFIAINPERTKATKHTINNDPKTSVPGGDSSSSSNLKKTALKLTTHMPDATKELIQVRSNVIHKEQPAVAKENGAVASLSTDPTSKPELFIRDPSTGQFIRLKANREATKTSIVPSNGDLYESQQNVNLDSGVLVITDPSSDDVVSVFSDKSAIKRRYNPHFNVVEVVEQDVIIISFPGAPGVIISGPSKRATDQKKDDTLANSPLSRFNSPSTHYSYIKDPFDESEIRIFVDGTIRRFEKGVEEGEEMEVIHGENEDLIIHEIPQSDKDMIVHSNGVAEVVTTIEGKLSSSPADIVQRRGNNYSVISGPHAGESWTDDKPLERLKPDTWYVQVEKAKDEHVDNVSFFSMDEKVSHQSSFAEEKLNADEVERVHESQIKLMTAFTEVANLMLPDVNIMPSKANDFNGRFESHAVNYNSLSILNAASPLTTSMQDSEKTEFTNDEEKMDVEGLRANQYVSHEATGNYRDSKDVIKKSITEHPSATEKPVATFSSFLETDSASLSLFDQSKENLVFHTNVANNPVLLQTSSEDSAHNPIVLTDAEDVFQNIPTMFVEDWVFVNDASNLNVKNPQKLISNREQMIQKQRFKMMWNGAIAAGFIVFSLVIYTFSWLLSPQETDTYEKCDSTMDFVVDEDDSEAERHLDEYHASLSIYEDKRIQ